LISPDSHGANFNQIWLKSSLEEEIQGYSNENLSFSKQRAMTSSKGDNHKKEFKNLHKNH
jgi:hypothetical protein